MFYALVLILMHPGGQEGLFGVNLWNAGRMDALAMLGGEVWRTVTALTLHADMAHLAGNMAFGAAFGAAAVGAAEVDAGLAAVGDFFCALEADFFAPAGLPASAGEARSSRTTDETITNSLRRTRTCLLGFQFDSG